MSATSDPPTPSRSFQETQTVWIADRLSEGEAGIMLANGYVMESYLRPLTTYCSKIGLARSARADADELVHSFFANRLSNPDYLKSWLTSGLRLRQWLRNGLHFYVHELRRKNATQIEGQGLSEEVASDGLAHDHEFEHAWALASLDLAIKETKAGLEKRGRRDEWEMFWSHFVGGVPHAKIGERFQLTAAQVAQRAFAVGAQLRDALYGILRKDGAFSSEIDLEVRSMMEVLHEIKS